MALELPLRGITNRLIIRLRVFESVLPLPKRAGRALSAVWVIYALLVRAPDDSVCDDNSADAVLPQKGQYSVTDSPVNADVELVLKPSFDARDLFSVADSHDDFGRVPVGWSVERDRADGISVAVARTLSKSFAPGFVHRSFAEALAPNVKV